MVSKVSDQIPNFNIEKYREKGDLGKHLDKSLRSGINPETTFTQDVYIVIDNLIHNLMAICFQVETCVKGLKENEFKWINKESVVGDLHKEIHSIFLSIKKNSNYEVNLKAIEDNLEKFEEIYQILRKAGVDKETIEDIKNKIGVAKDDIKNAREKKENAKRKFDDGFPPLLQKVTKEHEVTSKRKKHVVNDKKSKTYEDRSSLESSTLDKEYARVRGFKKKEKELRGKNQESPSKFTRQEAESLFTRKDSDVQEVKNRLQADELMIGHPTRVGGLKQEIKKLKQEIRSLEKELISLQTDKPKLKQRDEYGNLTNLTVNPAERKKELARIREQKDKIPGITKQLEEAKALLENKRADLKKQNSPKEIEKSRLKKEYVNAKENEKLLRQQYKEAVEQKNPAERKAPKKELRKATAELKIKKAAYEDFKKKNIK